MNTKRGLIFLSFIYLTRVGQSQTVIYSDLSGEDFSFSEKWHYPEGVYINQYGQLSCDGLCPPEIDRMKKNGKIIEDSLTRFYSVVDTTHQFVSLKGEAKTYEYLDADYASAFKNMDGSFVIESKCNVATHSSLHIEFKENRFEAMIIFNSITNEFDGVQLFKMKPKGMLHVDKLALQKGILKAKFDLEFYNHLEEDESMYWKGLINCSIIKK